MASNMWLRVLRICSIFILLPLFCDAKRNKVIQLDEDNWQEMLEKEWMVEFYAPWCPACKALQPLWEEFSSWSDDLGIQVGQVDVTSSPGLSGRFLVTALPTIFHVLDGEFRQYRGARDKDAFISFVEDKKWKSLDAIPSWKSPSSFQMSIVSYFFKLSQILRAVHTRLMDEYGLPTWGSYVIFAIVTIIVGALLGLLLVCIIDLIYPPKPLLTRTTSISSGPHEKPLKETGEEGSGDKGSGEDDDLEEEEEDEYPKDDLVDEEGSDRPARKGSDRAARNSGGSDSENREEGEGSPNVRKRKARKAD